jgi:uncharacterized membrane protein
MTVAGFFKLYGVALITFFAMDLLWLGVVARGFYQTHMGHLMKPSVNWAAAVAFYLLFLVGLVVLVIWPAIQRQSFTQAVLLGALFGLVTYAAYDLTNLATLNGFPLKVALVDLVWGTLLCATVSAVAFLFATTSRAVAP